MGSGDPGASATTQLLDPDSLEWLRTLRATGPEHDDAVARLHALLLRIARGELHRRQHGITGPELDDIAHQAANDALVAILGKIDGFRGTSRFTTWAFAFVMFEVSGKLGRHFWRHPAVALDAEDWDRLPDRFGFAPEDESRWRELLDALRRAIDDELSDRQRMLFVAIVLNGVPLDAMVARLGASRNAIYQSLFDARRKLRANLVAHGHLDNDTPRRP